jgi:hypothetical protein
MKAGKMHVAMPLALLSAAFLLLWVTGCGGGNEVSVDTGGGYDGTGEDLPDQTGDQASIDGFEDVHGGKDKGPFPDEENPPDGTGQDFIPPDAVIACTGPGEFLCPCEDNGDCVSGYCVDAKEGKVCTKSCVEDCPLGWACLQDENALPDVIFICIPQNVYLCQPCTLNDECHSPFANKGDICVPHGDNGSFCGVDCSFAGVCPDAYVCAEFVTEAGATANQCVPAGGECQCSERAIKLGAKTPCKKVNGYGVCEGERSCGPEGLSECSAITPKPEECNKQDDNCDGVIDPPNSLKCITWYYDQDGDSYGIGIGTCECSSPSAYHVSMGGDCDDSSIGVNPSVNEACNFLDDNCDGQTDEAYAVGCETMYYDKDNDGWGDAGKTNCLCKETPDYKKKAGDCNDASPVTHPEAEELCDGEDNDCDEIQDEDNALGCIPYYLDQDGDGYGLSDQLKCLCAKVGQYVATKGGDCDDTKYEVHPTVVELCDGLDNDCDGTIDEDEAVTSCGIVAHGEVGCQGGCVITSCEGTYFDLNQAYADGCECETESTEVPNQICMDATFIGNLADAGDSYSATAKIVPVVDSDWYKFHAVDGLDPEGCDTFHLRVRFLKNPNDSYLFDVFQGGCGGADNICSQSTVFEWYVDFFSPDKTPKGQLPGVGECKCMPDANHVLTADNFKDDTDDNTHQCVDQTNDYYIRVYRKDGTPVVCDEYQIEMSNGIKE